MDYKSKKVAIISVLSTLLVVGAIAGTVAFIKGNNQSGAAENVISNETANIIVENVIDDGNTNTNTNTNSVVPSDGGNAGGNGGNVAPVAPDNTPTIDENGNQVIIDTDGNSHVIGPVTNDDGSTTTTEGDAIGGYIQRTVIPEHMVWEWTIVDWREILPKTIAANIEIPSLEGEKYYEVDGQKSDTAVVVGQNITYYIDVINTGDTKLEQFRVVDSVPEGTELVKGTISDEGNLDEYGRVIWKLDLNPQETKTVSFKVTVTSNEVKSIVNQAKVNGEGTNETKTPVIEANKKAFVVEKDGTFSTRDAKVDETIRYVISLTNKSDVEGTTTVKDTVPENTRFVSADERFTVSEDKSSLEATISVPAGETIELTFDVEVYDDEEDDKTTTSVRNIAVIGGVPTPPVDTKVANITTKKIATPDDPLHELGKIHYELVSTNNGDGKGTVTITDTVPKGTELVPDSITNGGTMGENGVITWTVTLEAGKSATSAFDVIVLPFSNEEGKLTVINAAAKQDGEKIPETETEATKEYKSVSVNKDFHDKDNVDGKRPTEVTVRLFNEKTNATVSQVELNKDNNWAYTFINLDKYNSEKEEIQYKVEEINIDEYYTATVTPIENTSEKDKYAFEITNTLKYELIKVPVTVTKTWVDHNNASGNRPTSIVLDLYADGEFLKSSDPIKGNEKTDEGWTYTFTDLQKYHKDGTEIEYEVREQSVTHYDTADTKYSTDENGNIVATVTNSIRYGDFKTKVVANKVWDDNSNRTENRPTEIRLSIKNDRGETPKGLEDVIVVKGDSKERTWTYESPDLPKYYDDNGETIEYTVTEQSVTHYDTADTKYSTDENGNTVATVTNSIRYGDFKTKVKAKKQWVDNNNNAGKRPGSIHVNVFDIEKETPVLSNQTVRGDKNAEFWTYESGDLPRYHDDGTEIEYTVKEVEADQTPYTTTYGTYKEEDDDVTEHTLIINTISYDGYTIPFTVKKTWYDDGDREKARPDSVSFDLYVRKEDGDKYVTSHTVEKDSWEYTFTGLAQYDNKGNELSYYVVEAEANIPEHYTMERVSDTEIKNRIDYTSFTIDQTVTKVWEDEPDTVHNPITIEIFDINNPTEIKGSHTFEDGETTFEFEGLQKYYEDGSTITYNIRELEANQNNYRTTYKQSTLTVTNTIVDPNTEITITKIWKDPEDVGKHKDITVNIIQNAGTSYEKIYKEITITGKTDDTYTITESGLPLYLKDDKGYVLKDGHVQINTYSVEEVTNGWTDYAPTYSRGKNGEFVITNTKIGPDKAWISGTKTWLDDNKTEHPTIKIYLTKKVGDSYVRVKDDNGNDRYYELSNGNVDYKFENLPKYDEDGQYIKYGVEEEQVEGYRAPSYNGNDITNLILPGTTSVPVEKTWIRPDENYEDVTIRLYQGDTEVNSVTFKKSDYVDGKATYTFTTLRDGNPLPMYDNNGHKYVYTTREDAITGYHQKTDAGENKYINVVDAGEQDITVAKVWEAPEGDIPAVQVALTIDGVQQEPVTLTYPDKISHKFEKLPIYNTETGKKIVYSVDEINVPEGYNKNVAVSEDGLNYTITNSIIQKYVTVDVTKTWIDPTNEEHPDVKFILKQNGVQYPDENTYYTLTGGYTDDQKALDTITNLPRYKMVDGKYVKDENGRVVENVYTVEEVKVAGYDMIPEEGPEGHKTDAGNWEYAVTNRITQTKTSINVRKLWSIPEGVTVTKPDIRIRLYRSTNKTDPVDTGKSEIIRSNGNGICAFYDLEVYDLDETSEGYGERYIYTVTEEDAVTGKPVRNFVPSIAENADGSGYTITNTFDQEIKGTVTYTQTTHGEADVKVPMDVVFILDTSSSMDAKGGQQRGNKMVAAVNQTIKYLMNDNIENRVSVVTFGGFNNNNSHDSHYYNYLNDPDARVLLPLGTYLSTSTNSGNFLTISETSGEENDVIGTSVYQAKVVTDENGNKTIQATSSEAYSSGTSRLIGATYTQMGIATGANQLINAENKKYTTVVDGMTYETVRTPVIILLSDGGPTVYTATTNVTTSSTEAGDEKHTRENEVYWTVKTAKAYKDLVTAAYYTDNNVTGSAKFYTIGYGISNTTGENQAEKVVLNPIATNISVLPNYDDGYTDWFGYHNGDNHYKAIYDKLHNEDSTLNSYSYSDKYQGTSFNTQELKDFMTQALSSDNTIQITRDITLAESDDMKVYMPDIDRSKEFSIKIDGTTVTTSTSYERVKQDTTNGEYYVDLTDLPKGTTIDIFYTKVTQTAGE